MSDKYFIFMLPLIYHLEQFDFTIQFEKIDRFFPGRERL